MAAEDRVQLVEVLTSSTTLNRRHSGILLTNRGAAGAVTLTLPAGEKGLRIRARKITAQTFTLACAGSDVIVNSAGGSVTSLAVNVSLEIQFDGTAWTVLDEIPSANDTIVAGQLADGAVDATAVLAAGIVAPTKMAFTGMKMATFTGAAAAGAITLTGAAVGDRVVAVVPIGEATTDTVTVLGATVAQPNALFESAITVINQIQQASATDLSDVHYLAILMPATA